MSQENAPSSVVSPEGRRILIAVVTGTVGEQIQSWRERHDPVQARRLPPHTTLCYWAPTSDPSLLERQVRHAFASPVEVHLGAIREFDNDQRTFYIEVVRHAPLDEARRRLYDGTHLALPASGEWPWHVTCVRESRGWDIESLRQAATDLQLHRDWRIDTVSYLELRGDEYLALATWNLP